MTDRLFADQRGGGDRPPVALLHGFGGAHGVWDAVRRELGPGIPTIAYDLPGHGASLPLADAVPPKRSAAALLADLEERSPRPFHLVGHSMGGAIATLMAISRPDRVASLTLLAPGGFGETIDEALLANLAEARTVEELRAALSAMAAPGHQPSTEQLGKLAELRAVPGQAELLIGLAQMIARDGRQGMIPRDLFAALTMPVTVVWGELDKVLSPSHADGLPAGFIVHRLPDAGHMLPEERPDFVAQLLRATAT